MWERGSRAIILVAGRRSQRIFPPAHRLKISASARMLKPLMVVR